MICKPCNNKWLGTWEGQLKPTLCPLIGGRTQALSPAVLAKIAAWLWKTALLMPYAVPDPKTWPESYYGAFYDSDKQVPPDVLIWLAAYAGGGDPIWADASVLSAMSPGRQGEPRTQREGHMVTFYVGHLLAKIQLVPDHDLGAAGKPGFSGGSAFRIWPPANPPEGLIWPPPAFTLEAVQKEAKGISIP